MADKDKKKPKKKPKSKLTDKQRLFVTEYLVDMNGTQAYIRAYKCANKSTAMVNASKLLRNANIREEINNQVDEIIDQTQQEGVLRNLRELETIGYSDIGELIEYDETGVKVKPSKEVNTRVVKAVVMDKVIVSKGQDVTEERIKFKLELHDKVRALEKIGTFLGMFKEHVEVTGKNGRPILFELPKGCEKW